jgi:lipopolysaccharide exporter
MKSLKNSYWIKSGFYSIGSRIFVLLFGFGSFYILVRYFSKEDFGTWALFLTIVTIIEMSRNGLIQNALIKLVHSHEPDDYDKIISATWILNAAYTVLIFLLLIFASIFIGDLFKAPEIKAMFLYYGITMFLLIPLSQFNYIQQSKFSFSGIFWGTFVRYGAFFISNLVIHLFSIGITLSSLVLIQAFCTFLGLIISYALARDYLTMKFEWSADSIRKVFHFGKFVMGTNIFSMIYKSIDQFTVGYFLNTSSVASYITAIRLSNLIEYPTSSIAEVVYPKSVANYEKDGKASSKMFFEKSVALTMALTLPIVLATFFMADFIILVIAGSQYAESANILRVTILFGVFTPFFRQFGTAMDSSGRPSYNFFVLLFSVVISLILNYAGVQLFGIMGAAYGTLLSYLIISLVCFVLMARIFKVEMSNIYFSIGGYYRQAFQMAKAYLINFGNKGRHGGK